VGQAESRRRRPPRGRGRPADFGRGGVVCPVALARGAQGRGRAERRRGRRRPRPGDFRQETGAGRAGREGAGRRPGGRPAVGRRILRGAAERPGSGPAPRGGSANRSGLGPQRKACRSRSTRGRRTARSSSPSPWWGPVT
jgi:hypothetical protein